LYLHKALAINPKDTYALNGKAPSRQAAINQIFKKENALEHWLALLHCQLFYFFFAVFTGFFAFVFLTIPSILPSWERNPNFRFNMSHY
jgi:hypothetical protein